jgi:twitching motility protein PilT
MNDTLKTQNADLDRFLQAAAKTQASDVHLVPGYPATYRIHGKLVETSAPPLTSEAVRDMVQSILPERLAAKMHEGKNFDCSLNLEHEGEPCRFRANVYLSRGDWCACLRHVPNDIPKFSWMGFPEGLAQRLIAHANGLVIITGVTGSGKSTTLASLINMINDQGGRRVITVEEPIEYVFKRKGSTVITQREVGRDVDSFYDGLRSGLRQDPDVILLGEIRDRDTAQMALSAAETGHLILTTLHTKDAKGAITRFIDLFPPEIQDDVRTQLSLSLRSVVSQHLLESAKEGEKRALALEVLHVTQPARIAIKFGKIEAIESAIQTGLREGMVSLDEELSRLVSEKRITMTIARRFAKDPNALGT